MTTGQFPKRRETDEQAQERIKELQKRRDELPPPYPAPLMMTKREYDLWHLNNARRGRIGR